MNVTEGAAAATCGNYDLRYVWVCVCTQKPEKYIFSIQDDSKAKRGQRGDSGWRLNCDVRGGQLLELMTSLANSVSAANLALSWKHINELCVSVCVRKNNTIMHSNLSQHNRKPKRKEKIKKFHIPVSQLAALT